MVGQIQSVAIIDIEATTLVLSFIAFTQIVLGAVSGDGFARPFHKVFYIMG